MALVPLNLLVTHNGKSKRQHVTCVYKCGDACSKPVRNTSENEYFGDIVKAMSRRSMLQAGGIAVLAVGAGSALAACGTDEQPAATPASSAPPAETPPGMKFSSVAPNSEDVVVVADGYEHAVVISWGDPVLANAPKFDVTKQSGAAQRGQFGFNNDFAGLLPIPAELAGQQNRFLLVTNFEYVSPQFMFPGYNADAPTREQFDVEIAAIGMGVVEVERTPEGLKPVMGRYNRRVTADTPITLTGPAAGTDFVKTAADPAGRTIAGTFANCSGGVTPWGTVLSGEENFHEYFGAAEGSPPPKPVDADRMDRYGLALEPSPLLWETFDPRFDLAKSANEANRFGYVVELNPWDANSMPVKHSALGRLKHEGANVYIADDGTVVVYTGDDERFDYMYKFISNKKMQPGSPNGSDPAAMAHNMTPSRRGHALRRQTVQRHPRQRDRRFGQAAVEGLVHGHGHVDPLAAHRRRRSGRVTRRGRDRAGGRGVHPPRCRQGRRHQDGPARGLRGQPQDRQGVRRADQQRRARRGR